jgi:serine/threonine protein kinase
MIDISKVWDKWKVESLIGEGAFGKVYKAVREEFGITSYCAIKVVSIPQSDAEMNSLRAEGLDDSGTATYFQGLVNDLVGEIKLMESMKGTPNIVSVEDYTVVPREGEVGWDIYIRMELLTPFTEYIKDKLPLPESEVIKLGIDVLSALEICGQRNVIHRDVKPDNIFVSEFGYYKLGDFGIARELEKSSGGNMSKKGTYNYMAPEVAHGQHYDASADTYSLGIVLYKLLNNNRLPFIDSDAAQVRYEDRKNAIDRRLGGETLPLMLGVGVDLEQVVLKACEFEPAKRFRSPGEFKSALEAVKKGESVLAALAATPIIAAAPIAAAAPVPNPAAFAEPDAFQFAPPQFPEQQQPSAVAAIVPATAALPAGMAAGAALVPTAAAAGAETAVAVAAVAAVPAVPVATTAGAAAGVAATSSAAAGAGAAAGGASAAAVTTGGVAAAAVSAKAVVAAVVTCCVVAGGVVGGVVFLGKENEPPPPIVAEQEPVDMEAVYAAFYEVLSGAVREHGRPISHELLMRNDGVSYARLLDFDGDGVPELVFLIDSDESGYRWQTEQELRIYSFVDGEAVRSYTLEEVSQTPFSFAFTENNRAFLRLDHIWNIENATFHAHRNGAWVEALNMEGATRYYADEFFVDGEEVSEEDYFNAPETRLGIVRHEFTSDEEDFDTVTETLNTLRGEPLPPVEMPCFDGVHEQDVSANLTDMGLLYVMFSEHSNEVPEGYFVRSDAAAGELLRHNDVVQIWISLGAEPVTFPNGLTEERIVSDSTRTLGIYYRNYLAAVNAQNPNMITNSSPTHRDWLEERIFGVNRNHLFEYNVILVDADTIDIELLADGRLRVTMRAMFRFEQTRRDGTQNGWSSNENLQTIVMYYNATTWNWYVDSSELDRRGSIGNNQIVLN